MSEFIEFEMPAGHTIKVEGEPIVEQPTPATRVMRGAKLLDEMEGSGWASSTSLPMLDLTSSRFCVLGQRFGSYENGVESLGISVPESRDLGFDIAATHDTWDEQEDEYAELEKAWRNEINARR